jgi:hypothetical protein
LNYPGDLPPTPEQRAELRLAANAAWLARSLERRAQEGDPPITLRDGRVTTGSQLDVESIERSNQKTLAAAKKAIDAERKVHRCYICGRQDLPRYARWFGLIAAVAFGMYLLLSETARETSILGYLCAAAVGAAFGSAMFENTKPVDEAETRRQFNEKPHE